MQRRFAKSFGHGASLAIAALVLMLGLLPGRSPAAEALSFEGKTVTIVIGSSAGGTTDASARLMGAFISKHLPGKPSVIVQSKPGAHSMVAMNYFTQQVKPDGLTLAVGSGSQLDPVNYRVPQSRYDPTKFFMIGGVDLGGGVVIIRNEALPRLKDKTATPVIMGSQSGVPHATMMPIAWGIDYLGWNVKWVSGYPSTTAGLALALERGEIDITAFSTSGLTGSLLDRSKYTIIYQTGSDRCHTPSSLPSVQGVPIFGAAMQGKITDPLTQQAFDYWCNGSSIGTWMALPPGTPAEIVDVYRTAFGKIAADPEFLEHGKKYSQDFSAVSFESLTAAARSNGQVSPNVADVLPQMLRRQGLTLN
jgi:hypothetical protein